MNEGVVGGEDERGSAVVGGEDELSKSLRYAILCTLSYSVEREN